MRSEAWGAATDVVNLHRDGVGNAQVPQKFRNATRLGRRGAEAVVSWRSRFSRSPAAVIYYKSHPNKALTDKDHIVLADFTNTTGDSVFDGTLRQGLASQLEQTPFVKSGLRFDHRPYPDVDVERGRAPYP